MDPLPPVRCSSCGKVIAMCVDELRRGLADGLSRQEALERTGVKRMCCRMRVLGGLAPAASPEPPRNVTGHIEFLGRK